MADIPLTLTPEAAILQLASEEEMSRAGARRLMRPSPRRSSPERPTKSGETTQHDILPSAGPRPRSPIAPGSTPNARAPMHGSCSRSRCFGATGWIALSPGGVDREGKPIGTDFVGFYSASRLALDGVPALAYDVSAHWAAQKALFGPTLGYTAFFYPPPALLISLPLALAPFSRRSRLAGRDRLRVLSRPARVSAVARPGGVPRLSRGVR